MRKGCLLDVLDWATDIGAISTPLLEWLGIPASSSAIIIIGKSLKMFLKYGIPNVFKDFQSRPLSPVQKDRLDEVKVETIRTVYRLIEKNGWDDNHPESSLYIQNYIEYADDLVNKAVNESRHTKRLLIGAYLGSTIYTKNCQEPDWDNVFYLSSLMDKLTVRQVVLLKLIADEFSMIDEREDVICITNKVAISELKEIANQNMWVGRFSCQPDPTYMAIPLRYICPTDLTKEFISSMLMPNGLQGNVEQTIKSLDLRPYSQTELPETFKNDLLYVINNKKGRVAPP